jgi:hypothetical protein
MKKVELSALIKKGELEEFLLGEGSKYQNHRPEIDYQRWGQLSDYYHSLDSDNSDRILIEETTISLLRDKDTTHIIVALEIALLIELDRIKSDLQELLISFEDNVIDQLLLYSISRAIVRFRFEEIVLDLIDRLVKNRDLVSLFEAGRSGYPHYDIRPTDSELWIMRQISEYFKKGQNVKPEVLLMTLISVFEQSRQATRVARGYLSNAQSSASGFLELLSNALAQAEN